MLGHIDACCTIGGPGDPEPPAPKLLAEMDRAGVARALIMPPERCFAWENGAGNDLVLQAAHADSRLIAAATVNPWRPDAVEVVRRALDAGARMLAFAPGVQGFLISGRHLNPILEGLCARGLKIPVYVHTGHHSHAAPSQLALLAARFPQVNFIMGHCGSTDYAGDVTPVYRQHPNIWLEASFGRPPKFVGRLKETGYDRALMGSGYPYNDLAFEWAQTRRLLPAEHHEAVFGGNLRRLLGGEA
jgi:hypothetical protein